MQTVLRKALVADAICSVDTSGAFYLQNPYMSQPTGAVAAIVGTYSVSAWSTTDDTCTVTDEASYAGHVFKFEQFLSSYDIMSARMDEMIYAVAERIDAFAVNGLCEDATSSYTTPAGGFTTAANVGVIFSNLVSKVSGYSDMYNGMYIILENTDITGVIQTQIGSGFSYADKALNNGFLTSYMGVDIYVVRSGTFVSATIGSRSDFTNSGHRVFGIKKTATLLRPASALSYEEKGVTSKTGKEIAVVQPFGFKLWTQKAALHVDITLA